jgi:hypothetical protein
VWVVARECGREGGRDGDEVGRKVEVEVVFVRVVPSSLGLGTSAMCCSSDRHHKPNNHVVWCSEGGHGYSRQFAEGS